MAFIISISVLWVLGTSFYLFIWKQRAIKSSTDKEMVDSLIDYQPIDATVYEPVVEKSIIETSNIELSEIIDTQNIELKFTDDKDLQNEIFNNENDAFLDMNNKSIETAIKNEIKEQTLQTIEYKSLKIFKPSL